MDRNPQAKANRVSKALAVPSASQPQQTTKGRISSVSPRPTRSPRASSTTSPANTGAKNSADKSPRHSTDRSPRASSRVTASKSTADSSSRTSVANKKNILQEKPSKSPSAQTSSEDYASPAVESSIGETEFEKMLSAEEEAAHWRNEAARLRKENERLQRRVTAAENLTTKVDVLIGHFEEQEETLRASHDSDVSALRAELSRLQEELARRDESTFVPGPVAVARGDLAAYNWARLAVAAASSAHLKGLTTLKKHHRKSLRKENRESKVHTPRSGTRTPRPEVGTPHSEAVTPTTPRTPLLLHIPDVPQYKSEAAYTKEDKILQHFITFAVYVMGSASASAFKFAAWKASSRSRQLQENAGTYRIAAAAAEIIGQWSRLVVLAGRLANLDLCARLLHRHATCSSPARDDTGATPSTLSASGQWLRFVLLAEVVDNSRLSVELVHYGTRARALGADMVADANRMLMDSHWARLVQLNSFRSTLEMYRGGHIVASEMHVCVRRWARLVACLERVVAHKSRLGFLLEVSEMMSTNLESSFQIADIES